MSIKNHLLQEEAINRSVSISENHLQRTVIGPRYKLSLPVNPSDDSHKEMLFDRQNDPHELHNCINDPTLQGIVRELKNALLKWDDSIPACNERCA